MVCPRCGTETTAWPCPECGFPEIMRNRGIRAVSYTHLDVYKRQHIYSIHLFVIAVFGDMSKLIRQKYS